MRMAWLKLARSCAKAVACLSTKESSFPGCARIAFRLAGELLLDVGTVIPLRGPKERRTPAPTYSRSGMVLEIHPFKILNSAGIAALKLRLARDLRALPSLSGEDRRTMERRLA